jgi:bis(5'-adenosyl)-triphosphatase
MFFFQYVYFILIIFLISYQVPHCHLHIIPRKVGDWLINDDIYKDIDNSTKVDNEERPPRSIEEMAKEAEYLRQLFSDDNVEN